MLLCRLICSLAAHSSVTYLHESVVVFQIVVLLQCPGSCTWKDYEDQCDEHEQPKEALQSGHGSSRTDFTGQEPMGKGPGQTHV